MIVTLGRLAAACQDAAASPADLAHRYKSLRAHAMERNDRHGWATADEFDSQFPTVDALVEIEPLDRALGEPSEPDGFEARAARLPQALVQLGAWATGVRLAYTTLREMDSK